jgi:hypothetical protein
MDTRLTIDQVAARLGVSRPTIRRRLRNGELRGERRPTKQGFVWEVLLDLPDDSPDDSAAGGQALTQDDPPATLQEGARLRDEHISDLRKRVDDQAWEITERHRLLVQAQQNGHRLTDSSSGEWPGSRNGQAVHAGPQSASSLRWEARCWWQRLLWG